jgi:hypothetical protein
VKPDLDQWLANPSVCVRHRRETTVDPDRLWEAAQSVRLSDTRMLGRLVRWRIPGVPPGISFEELFRTAPFMVLCDDEEALVSGLVGKIWTLRRDYPVLDGPEKFRTWSTRGTVRVMFANWVERVDGNGGALVSESRIAPIGAEGRIGLAAVRPFIAASQQLVASEGIEAAIRRAHRG